MKTTIIIGHPYSKSFNYAILERVRKKTTATVINLVTENFNPAMLSMDLAGFSKGQFSDPFVDNIKNFIRYGEVYHNNTNLVVRTSFNI